MRDARTILIRTALATTILAGTALAHPALAQDAGQYWDGSNTTPGSVPAGRAGNGTWDTTTPNWTNADGTVNTTWANGKALFNSGRLDGSNNCVGNINSTATVATPGVAATEIRRTTGCSSTPNTLLRFRGGSITLANNSVIAGSITFESQLIGTGNITQVSDVGGINLVQLASASQVAGDYNVSKGVGLWVTRVISDFSGPAPEKLTMVARLDVGGVLRVGAANGNQVTDLLAAGVGVRQGGTLTSKGGQLGVGGDPGQVTVGGGLWDAGANDIVISDRSGASYLRVGGVSADSASVGDVTSAYLAKNGEVRASRIVLGQVAGETGQLRVSVGGNLFTLQPNLASYTQIFGANDSSYTGTVTANSIVGGAGGGLVLFDNNGSPSQTRAQRQAFPLTFQPRITGNLAVKISAAEIHLTGAHDYTGTTTIESDGLLYLDGATLSGTSVTVTTGVLGGFGTIGGGVSFAPGATTLEGRSGQTLGMASLSLANDTMVNVTLGAPNATGLFNVAGALTLDGTLNVSNAGAFGNGVYRLFDYGGTLTDNGLVIGTLPGGSPATIQTSISRQVNLVVGAVMAPVPDIQFWDGAGTTANGAVGGGGGTWNTTTTNWTSANGDANAAWGGKFAVFQNAGGTVTIDAAGVGATGVQFANSGYRLEGGTLTLSAPATLRVGDGSAAGAAYSATIASVIAGSGGIDKTDMGTLILTGANTYTGATRVSGGALVINGSIGGTLTVATGGALGGGGRVGDLTVSSGATVAPGNSIGTLTIAGNYVQAAGSTYRVEINPAGQSDKIVIGGTATIQGGTVYADKAAGTYLPGTRYTIVTAAGGRTGTYTTLDQNMPFLNLALAYDANNVFLDVVRNVTSFCSVAATLNQCATGSGVESLSSGTLFNAVVSLPNNDAARAAFTALSGEIYPSAQAVAIDSARLPRDAVLSRLATAPAGNGVWGQVFGSWGKANTDGNAFLANRDTTGFVTGIDAGGEKWRAGVAGGYTRATLNVGSIASRGTLKTTSGLGYVGANIGKVRLRVGAGYADLDLDTQRSLAFAGFTDALRGKANGSLLQGFAEAGYSIAIGKGSVEPFVGYSAVRVRTDRFVETGGTAALTGAQQSDSFNFSTLGLRANLDLGGKVTLQGKAGWRHAFGTVVPTAAFKFAGGNNFVLAGTPINRDEAAIEAGLSWRITKALSLGVRYNGAIGKSSDDNSAQGVVSFAF